ncbi:hypothetical protein OXX69_008787, partial [Metschnikowia pulcherrima]
RARDSSEWKACI